jgi:ABC-type dipeptide/oligopeptide/nickel transport system permease subunit
MRSTPDVQSKDATPLSERLAFPLLVGWFIAYIGARGGLEVVSGTAARVALAVLPIPFFVGFLVSALRAIDRGDELFRRVHLEALAVAFPLTVVLLMVLGLFELATGLNPDDFSYRHIWPVVAIFYWIGYMRAWRRYQ